MSRVMIALIVSVAALVNIVASSHTVPHMANTLQQDIAASLVPKGVKAQWSTTQEQALQRPVEPEVYPPGWSCSPDGIHKDNGTVDRDHPCHCQRYCRTTGYDDKGKPFQTIVEDPACNQYCSKDHCSCGVSDCCDNERHTP